MSKHTPGPWRVQPYTWQRGNVSVFAPKFGRAPYGACVAHTPCSDGVGGADGALANAHLIAAAPDLLEALRSIADCCDEEHAARDYSSRQAEIRGIARAAIAKAEGQ
jgi:hypothetical protein